MQNRHANLEQGPASGAPPDTATEVGDAPLAVKKASDVSDRLAAIKEKLEKAKRERTNGTADGSRSARNPESGPLSERFVSRDDKADASQAKDGVAKKKQSMKEGNLNQDADRRSFVGAGPREDGGQPAENEVRWVEDDKKGQPGEAPCTGKEEKPDVDEKQSYEYTVDGAGGKNASERLLVEAPAPGKNYQADFEAAESEIQRLRSQLDEYVSKTQQLEMLLENSKSQNASEQLEQDLLNQIESLKREINQIKGQQSEMSSATVEEKYRANRLSSELEVAILEKQQVENELVNTREHLNKLKAQLLGDQDDEEERIKWRVDAEVKLALERLGIGPDGKICNEKADEQLERDLEIAIERADAAEELATKWEAKVAVRDEEVANLQRALGELSYESDAAEKLRTEIRLLQKNIRSTQQAMKIAEEESKKAQEACKEAKQVATEERRKAAAARDAEGAARQEMISLQVSYNDLANKMNSVDSKNAFKREFIVDVLKEMASLRHSQAMRKAIQYVHGSFLYPCLKQFVNGHFVCRMFDLTEKEVDTIWSEAKSSLANSWISFLESQSQDEEA